MEMGRKGYLKDEPNDAKAETSQVLGKVFKTLRDEGISMSQVASDLCIFPDELSKLVFGLVLTSLTGSGQSKRNDFESQPDLRVV